MSLFKLFAFPGMYQNKNNIYVYIDTVYLVPQQLEYGENIKGEFKGDFFSRYSKTSEL